MVQRAFIAARTSPPTGLRLVAISDTHGCHRSLDVPAGDVLVHAGDFTYASREADAVDFNDWLATLPHAHKIVAFGNHEEAAPWRSRAHELLSNATLLVAGEARIPRPSGDGPDLRVYATDFNWPTDPRGPRNPRLAHIPEGVDVLVSHYPARGEHDGGHGCVDLMAHVARARPGLVVCGHFHYAHGAGMGRAVGTADTLFVNAANAREHGKLGWPAVVVDFPAPSPARAGVGAGVASVAREGDS